MKLSASEDKLQSAQHTLIHTLMEGALKIRLFLDVRKQFPASKAARCKMHGAAKTTRSTGLGIKKQQQPCCRTLVTSKCAMLLGRSPRKNCKDDLDDQT